MPSHPRPATAFGLRLATDFALPGDWDVRADAGPGATELRRSAEEIVASAFSGAPAPAWSGATDGRRHVAERGSDGDVLFRLEGRPAFHVDARVTRILCAVSERDVTGMRVLLDSVLFTAALMRGFDVLHAAAVAGRAGAVAIVAGSGGGKSTLAAHLVSAGWPLVTDDILVLERDAGRPLAHSGPPLLTRPNAVAPPVGAPIAALDGETWCAVPTVQGPLPLAAVVLLERAPGSADELRTVPGAAVEILRHLLPWPDEPARERQRFELAADIAASAGVWRVVAPDATPPERLEALITPVLDGAPPRTP